MAKKDVIEEWLNERLSVGDVPRITDVLRYAKQTWPELSVKHVKEAVRVHPAYLQVVHQQRERRRSRKYRPILAQTLGYLHGDIAFFSVKAQYDTPPTYRSGILVFCDVVSHFVYIEILRKNRKADEIIHALKRVLAKHAAHHNYPIRGISFDQERSFMSGKVQAFLTDQNIKFTAFRFTSSKSKLAENTIGRIRQVLEIKEQFLQFKTPWWRLLEEVEHELNNRLIEIENKPIGNFTPATINESNLAVFLSLVHRASPSFNFGQFVLNDAFHKYQYPLGTHVKAKLVVTSSAVLGTKRSTQHLSDETFIITQQRLYVKKNQSVGELYGCKEIDANGSIVSKKLEHFDGNDIAPIEKLKDNFENQRYTADTTTTTTKNNNNNSSNLKNGAFFG